MNKLNAEQILEIIQNNMSPDEFAWDDFNSVKLGLGLVEEVEQHGGEDEGSSWYSVKHFKDHDVYIRIDGYYQSYAGTEFEEGHGYEVRPTQKTITVYE